MLWTIAVILVIQWLPGLVGSHTMGGFIHVLLVIAIVGVLIRIIQGRKLLYLPHQFLKSSLKGETHDS